MKPRMLLVLLTCCGAWLLPSGVRGTQDCGCPGAGEDPATDSVETCYSGGDTEETIQCPPDDPNSLKPDPIKVPYKCCEDGTVNTNEVAEYEASFVSADDEQIVFSYSVLGVTHTINIDPECTSCGGGNSSPGTGASGVGSLRVSLNLGRKADGESAGRLRLRQRDGHARIGTPYGLESALGGSLVVTQIFVSGNCPFLPESDQYLRQVYAPEAIVDIVTNDWFSYDIRFYGGDLSSMSLDATSGLLIPTESPHTVWRVENVNRTTNVADHIRVTYFPGDPVSTWSDRQENDYHWSSNSMSLTKGSGNAKRRERVETNTLANGNWTKTWMVDSGPGTAVVSTRRNTYGTNIQGGGIILEETKDPDGLDLWKRYGHDAQGRRTSVEHHDGSWRRWTFDAEGRKALDIRPLGDAVMTNSTEADWRWTEYDYHPHDVISNYLDGAVQALAYDSAGRLYLGGEFETIDGLPQPYLCRLNYRGQYDGSFLPRIDGGAVKAVELDNGGNLYIGGAFTSVDGTSQSRLARLGGDGALDSSFSVNVSGGDVEAIAFYGGNVVIGGAFSSVNGTNQANLAFLDVNGNLLGTNYQPNVSGPVYALEVMSDALLYVGGSFSTVNGTSRSNVARLFSSGGLDTNFVANTDTEVKAFAESSSGGVYIGGAFNTVNGTTRKRLALVNSTGTVSTNFNIGGVVTNYLVSVSGTTGVYNVISQVVSTGAVESLSVEPVLGHLWVGGDLSIEVDVTGANSATSSYQNLVLVDQQGFVHPWSPMSPNGGVLALATNTSQRIAAGGEFTRVGSSVQEHVARFLKGGLIDGSFDRGLDMVERRRPRTVSEWEGTNLIGRVYHDYQEEADGSLVHIKETVTELDAAFNDEHNLKTVEIHYPEIPYWEATIHDDPWGGKLKARYSPDGGVETHSYHRGSYSEGSGGNYTFTESELGEDIRHIVEYRRGSFDGGLSSKAANYTKRMVSIRNAGGRELYRSDDLWDGSAYAVLSWTQNELDERGRVLATVNSRGESTAKTWGCCGVSWERHADGTETDYSYDGLKRLEYKTVKGGTGPAGTQTDRITTYSYDADGNRLTETITGGGLALQVSSNRYDAAGRLVERKGSDGRSMTTAYSVDGRVTTVTNYAGNVTVTRRYADGRTHSVTGTAVVAKHYAYGVTTNGLRWTTVYTGPGGTNAVRWQKSYTDLAGRTVRVDKPGYGGTVQTSTTEYDVYGRVVKQTPGNGIPATLYSYNSNGERELTAQDVNANDQIDLAGPDRVSKQSMAFSYTNAPGSATAWWQVQESYQYPSGATPVLASRQWQRVTGLGGSASAPSPLTAGAILVGEQVSENAAGSVQYAYNYLDATNKLSASVQGSCCSGTNTMVSYNGQSVIQMAATGQVTTNYYDGLGRSSGYVTVSGTNGSRTVGITKSYDAAGRVAWQEDLAGNRTSFGYDAVTGQRTSVTNAAGEVTYTHYDRQGQVLATWGGTYPVAYDYDDYGQMTAMYTLRDTNLTLSGYSAISNNLSSFDQTQWQYEPVSGLLTNKLYADGNGTAYTYDSAGRLATRKWARGITTSYGYDASGNMTNVNYSDSTPDVSYQHNRIGQQIRVEQGDLVRQYAYDPQTLAPTNEVVTTGADSYTLERAYTAHGKASGVSLDSDYTVSYGYDAAGRLAQIDALTAGVSNRYDYSYLPGSHLIAEVASGDISRRRHYEAHRDLVTSVENRFDGTLISSYAYANDAVGRRTSVINEGQAFAEAGAAMNLYDYNERSEVIGAERRWGSDLQNPGAVVAGQDYAYDYDPIGNRISSSRGNYTHLYEANALNQYTNRQLAGVAHLLGVAATNATVTVNTQSTTRQDAYWYKDLAVSNTLSAAYEAILVEAFTTNAYASASGNVFVAQSPEQYEYDADGNLLSDGRFEYTWNGENRLIVAETDSVKAGTNVPAVRLEFAYDEQGRRIRKTVKSDYNAGSYTTTNVTTFIYDGWNMIAEETGVGTPSSRTNHYVWGLDLSGSLQGAGGVGGLLAVTTDGGTSAVSSVYGATYDANGNVGQYLDMAASNATASIAAHYEYDPFGNLVTQTGTEADAFAYRFSTKYLDPETGWYYYGYRYYSTELGRWVNRDPIQEWGGLNVYGLSVNDKVNYFDIIGLLFWKDVSGTRVEVILDTYWDVTREGYICKCDLLYEDESCAVTTTGCEPGSEYWEYVATESSNTYHISKQTEAYDEVVQTSQTGEILSLILGAVISGGISEGDVISELLNIPGLGDLVPSDFRTITRNGSSSFQNYVPPAVGEADLPECTFETLYSYAIKITKTVRKEITENRTPLPGPPVQASF